MELNSHGQSNEHRLGLVSGNYYVDFILILMKGMRCSCFFLFMFVLIDYNAIFCLFVNLDAYMLLLLLLL